MEKYSGIGSSKSATNIAGKTKPLAAMIAWRIAGDTQISGRRRRFRAMIGAREQPQRVLRRNETRGGPDRPEGKHRRQDNRKGHPMRRSRFTENEILHLLYEASAGVSVTEICSTAGVSLRTFYRWRRRFGGLNAPAVMKMKELAAENLRLRGLVSNLFERLRDPGENGPPPSAVPTIASPGHDKERKQKQAIRSAAEKCGGALTGRFASLRVNP
jgi:putative transposase